MPSIEFEDDRPPRSREELLARVYRRGLRRRRTRQGLIGGAAALLVLLLAVPVVGGSESDQRLQVAQEGDSTTTTEEPTTTVQEQVVPETTAVMEPAPTTTAPPRTTTTLHCRNSTDPRCGDFYWDPPPGPNQPMTVAVEFSPAEPKVGDQVVFRIVASDPDANPGGDANFFWHFGEETDREGVGGGRGAIPGCGARYGPWTPPPAVRGTWETSMSWIYQTAGPWTARFDVGSSEVCGHPYLSKGVGTVTVTVSQ